MILIAYTYLFEYLREMLFVKEIKKKYITQRKNTSRDIEYNSYKNLKLIIFDVDDTLTGFFQKFDENTKKIIKKLSQKYQVVILTNSTKGREEEIKKEFDKTNIFVKGMADKPMKHSFQFILEKFDISPENTMMVGDNPFADMWGAYRVNIRHRILIEPLSSVDKNIKETFFLFRILRGFERKLFIKK